MFVLSGVILHYFDYMRYLFPCCVLLTYAYMFALKSLLSVLCLTFDNVNKPQISDHYVFGDIN